MQTSITQQSYATDGPSAHSIDYCKKYLKIHTP